MSNSKLSVAFLICTEQGSLEKKSILFARSLRKFGGTFKDSPIYSLAPRKDRNISKSTETEFNELNVIHEYHDLNHNYKDYNFANKIATCKYFEEQLKQDVLVFCDSDQLVLGELTELNLGSANIAMQNVAIKGIGTTEKDENAHYWESLYDLFQVNEKSYSTLKDGERILQYFNAGLIATKRKLGLFRKWSDNFDLVMEKQLFPPSGNFFTEQCVLSVTISSMNLNIKVLPEAYNFHLLRHTDSDVAMKKIETGEIKLLHYHSAFDQGCTVKLPSEIDLSASRKLNWLNQELVELGLNKKPFISHIEAEFIRNQDKIKSVIESQISKSKD